MPPLLHTIQAAFSGGEFSPSLYARVDIAKYLSGLKTARNVNILPHGGVRNRQGTRYVASAGDSSHPVRLIPFVASAISAYIIELGDYYARFFSQDAKVVVTEAMTLAWVTSTPYVVGNYVKTGSPLVIYYCIEDHTSGTFATDLAAGKWRAQTVFEIPTPWAAADIFELKFAQSADVLYVAHPDYAPQMLSFYGSTNWLLSAYSFLNGPFMPQNTVRAKTITPDGIADGSGTVLNISNIYAFTSSGGSPLPVVGIGTATPHGLVTGNRTTINSLDGALAALLNGNEYSVEVTSSTDFKLMYLGTTTYVQASFSAYVPSTGTITIPGPITIKSNFSFFDSDQVGALIQLSELISAQATSATFTTGLQASSSIKCGHDWSVITSGAWTGTVSVQASIDGGNVWTTIQTLQSNGSDNYQTSGDTGYDQCLIRALSNSSWSGTGVVDISSKSFQWSGVVQILSITNATEATAHVLPIGDYRTGLSSTNAMWEWSEGSWSTYRGWPSSVTFYQDRLCWSGSPSEPQTIWCSKTASYNDFGISSPLQEDDGFSILLPSRQLNSVQNLVVMAQGMVALTTDSEWMVAPGSGGVFSASSVDVNLQGHRGSSRIDPVVVGIEMLLMQQMGSVCRNLIYQLAVNGFFGDNISIISQHLFSGYTIREMAYAQEPDSIVWAVRSDGKLLSCTYMRDQEMNAWTWHDTDGLFESVCTIPNISGGYNEPWFVVNRGGVRMIEYMPSREMGTDSSDQYFVDSGLSYDGSPETVFSGLDHLDGKTVSILADGNVIPQQVVASGQITLDTAASTVHVGLPFISDVETLRIEAPSQTGTAQGRRVVVPEITVRFWNSRGGYLKAMSQDISQPSSTGVSGFDEIIERSSSDDPTLAMPLRTQDYKHTMNGGYDFGAHLMFRQVDPLPFTILAFIPKVEVSDN